MRPALVRRTTIVALSLSGLACADASAPAPRAPTGQFESLKTVVTHRERFPDERLPTVSIVGYSGQLDVRVARLALCDTQVQAGVSRTGGTFNVVALIGSNPSVLCAANDGRWVVEYQTLVPQVALGLYDVSVFEGGPGDGEPRFIGHSRVWVSGPGR